VTTAFVEKFQRAALNGGAAPADWLSPVRGAALRRFAELGLPTQKNEDWHFTSVQPLAAAPISAQQPAHQEPAVTAFELERLELGRITWPTLVFVNGRFSPLLSRMDSLPAGVVALPLAAILDSRSQLAERHLSSIAAYENHAFTALNTAFTRDGAFIHIAAGAEVQTPVRLLYVTDGNGDGATMQPRTLIIAEPNSRASILESYVASAVGGYFTNAVTEIAVRSGATLHHYRTQGENRAAFHVGTVEARQERDSHFVSFSVATGARLSRINVYTTLAGEGCGATLYGLYMVDGEQHVDHQTRIEHAAPSCFSRELYKGILDGSSHGVFNGKVYVRPEAQKTDGKQSNNNLLLSERAHVDTKPQLEIFADDVKCTHGATVGRIDEVALFYMRSRGLDPVSARRLLTYAFAAEVLEEIPLEALRQELESITMNRFIGVGP
jgi:Fe-S cluster assembly protein SufD